MNEWACPHCPQWSCHIALIAGLLADLNSLEFLFYMHSSRSCVLHLSRRKKWKPSHGASLVVSRFFCPCSWPLTENNQSLRFQCICCHGNGSEAHSVMCLADLCSTRCHNRQLTYWCSYLLVWGRFWHWHVSQTSLFETCILSLGSIRQLRCCAMKYRLNHRTWWFDRRKLSGCTFDTKCMWCYSILQVCLKLNNNPISNGICLHIMSLLSSGWM